MVDDSKFSWLELLVAYLLYPNIFVINVCTKYQGKVSVVVTLT